MTHFPFFFFFTGKMDVKVELIMSYAAPIYLARAASRRFWSHVVRKIQSLCLVHHDAHTIINTLHLFRSIILAQFMTLPLIGNCGTLPQLVGVCSKTTSSLTGIRSRPPNGFCGQGKTKFALFSLVDGKIVWRSQGDAFEAKRTTPTVKQRHVKALICSWRVLGASCKGQRKLEREGFTSNQQLEEQRANGPTRTAHIQHLE